MAVLVIKKVRDASVLPPFVQLVSWLVGEKNMVVHVEAAVLDDPGLADDAAFGAVRDRLMTFTEGKDDLTDKIDFIVCLGGDGTLLYASSLFQQSVPPVMAFHMGSLGFLTPFEVDNFEQQITHVLEGWSNKIFFKIKFIRHASYRPRCSDAPQPSSVHRHEEGHQQRQQQRRSGEDRLHEARHQPARP